jgi:hypothetical protein
MPVGKVNRKVVRMIMIIKSLKTNERIVIELKADKARLESQIESLNVKITAIQAHIDSEI